MERLPAKSVARAAELQGIEYWGVCPFSAVENFIIPCRAQQRLPEKPQSVIVFLFPYLLEAEKYEELNISRYAVPEDYHETAMEILTGIAEELKKDFPESSFAPFCDNSPIPEVRAAALCSLGRVGKNSLLINEKYGSWVFIGEIVTDCSGFAYENTEILPCTGCGACIKKCPAAAVGENGGIDTALCLSNVSQRKGTLSEKEEKLISQSGCAWGCDICQEVCPMNKSAQVTPLAAMRENALARIDENTPLSGRAFAWRGKNVISRNLQITDIRKKL